MGLSERENMRKKSVIGSMIYNSQESGQNQPSEIIITGKEKTEKRTKRVNFLIPPSVYDQAQKKCENMGISLNECINQFLVKWVE